jgi:hypothetical protein
MNPRHSSRRRIRRIHVSVPNDEIHSEFSLICALIELSYELVVDGLFSA